MSKYGLTVGTPDIQSTGAITFGPDGILFVADNAAGSIFAIDIEDTAGTAATQPIEVDHLDTRLAAYLGVNRADVGIRGMAVHPSSQAVYLSVTRGRGEAATPVLIRVSADGDLRSVTLADVPFAKTELQDAPSVDDERTDVSLDGSSEDSEDFERNGIHIKLARRKLRTSTVTDLAWVDGTLLVAGASNEEFSSALRTVPFPFGDDVQSSSLEIYHVSHGKYETASPIRTFVPFDGNTSVLASYTCTPVVHFSLLDLHAGAQAKGRTVAELGAMNQPLDMISYMQDGAEYLLVSNTRHPLIKIPSAPIADQPPLVDPGEPVGVPREELDHEGVSWMANLNGSHVLMMQRDAAGDLHLHSYSTAAL